MPLTAISSKYSCDNQFYDKANEKLYKHFLEYEPEHALNPFTDEVCNLMQRYNYHATFIAYSPFVKEILSGC